MGDQRFLSLSPPPRHFRTVLLRDTCVLPPSPPSPLPRSVRTSVANSIEILVQIARVRVVRVREPPLRDRTRSELKVANRTFPARNTDFYTVFVRLRGANQSILNLKNVGN